MKDPAVCVLSLEDVRLAVREQMERGNREPRQWFNVAQASDYLGVSPDSIYTMVKRGKLVPRRPNGPKSRPLLFSRAQLDDWVLAESA
jgi:excisionase family DNA binding protein